MTPIALLAKAGEIALRHGPDVVAAWSLIEQSLRSEVPELRREDLPHTDETYDDAVAAKKREFAEIQAAALKSGHALDDPDEVDDEETPETDP